MRRSYLVTGRFAVIDAYDNLLTDQEILNKIFIVSHLRAVRRNAIFYKRAAKKHPQ